MVAKRKVRKSKERGEDGTTNLPSMTNQFRSWRVFRGYPNQNALALATQIVDPAGAGFTRATICRLESGALKYSENHIELLSLTLKVAPRDLIGTDPFNSGDIFAVYAGLSKSKQRRAEALLAELSGRPKPSK